jgi:hypothetical protein
MQRRCIVGEALAFQLKLARRAVLWDVFLIFDTPAPQ